MDFNSAGCCLPQSGESVMVQVAVGDGSKEKVNSYKNSFVAGVGTPFP